MVFLFVNCVCITQSHCCTVHTYVCVWLCRVHVFIRTWLYILQYSTVYVCIRMYMYTTVILFRFYIMCTYVCTFVYADAYSCTSWSACVLLCRYCVGEWCYRCNGLVWRHPQTKRPTGGRLRWEGTTGGNRHTCREVRALVHSPQCFTSPRYSGHIGWTVLCWLCYACYQVLSSWYLCVCVYIVLTLLKLHVFM